MQRLPFLLFITLITILLLPATTYADQSKVPENAAVIWVDHAGDDYDQLCQDGVANDCSLRSAIDVANASAAPDAILFMGDYDIMVTAPLPTILYETQIFPLTREISLFADYDVADVFVIAGDDVWIDSLTVAGGDAVIEIQSTADRTIISNLTIGPDSGTACGTTHHGNYGISVLGNATTAPTQLWVYDTQIHCMASNGIHALRGSQFVIGEKPDGEAAGNFLHDNSIGMYLIASSDHRIVNNSITANTSNGIRLSVVTNSVLQGNTISGNGSNGLQMQSASNNNEIGCSFFGSLDEAHRNHITDNDSSGISISDSDDNHVFCNYIGVGPDGVSPAGNTADGIRITDGASGNIIGGTTIVGSPLPNVIAANAFRGIFLNQAGQDNIIRHNWIGRSAASRTSEAGTLGNGSFGIDLYLSPQTSIGTGTCVTTFCLEVADNVGAGIRIDSSGLVTIGRGTYIYNNLSGIKIEDSANLGIYPQSVWNNTAYGVSVEGISSQVHVQPISIHSNGGLPIDLNRDGATANDPGDGDSGPNGLLNYPEVTFYSEPTQNVWGTACADCFVEVYAAIGNPRIDGGGTFVVSSQADASGNWSFALADYGLTIDDVTFVAVDDFEGSSEMSPVGFTPTAVTLESAETLTSSPATFLLFAVTLLSILTLLAPRLHR